MTDTYFDTRNFNRTEIAILQEKVYFNDSSPKKFKIPVLMPNAGKVSNNLNTSNILNKEDIGKLGIGKFQTIDYITIPIPDFIRSSLSYDIDGYSNVGIQFLVTFVGGEITKPRLIGVY